ncbi:MAG: hypothetical protein LC114_02960, partial [Bryobacterales bacterium]|nr:hypothetical protein [Bryobacterales bacterium]
MRRTSIDGPGIIRNALQIRGERVIVTQLPNFLIPVTRLRMRPEGRGQPFDAEWRRSVQETLGVRRPRRELPAGILPSGITRDAVSLLKVAPICILGAY